MLLLEGISQHGKNRIREHGAEWRMVATLPSIQAPSHTHLKGPFASVVSERTGDRRWVSLTDDPDFSIMTKEELR